MPKQFKFTFINEKMDTIKSMSTVLENINVGKGMDCEIRIQKASVMDLHLRIAPYKKILMVYGNNVNNNGVLLSKDLHSFEYGDIISLLNIRFSINEMLNELVDEEIKECNWKVSWLPKPDLYEYQLVIESGLCESVSDDKFKKSGDQHILMQEEEKSKMVKVPGETMSKEGVQEINVEGYVMDGQVQSKKITNIKQEVTTSHFIDSGVVYEHVSEKIDIKETETFKNGGNQSSEVDLINAQRNIEEIVNDMPGIALNSNVSDIRDITLNQTQELGAKNQLSILDGINLTTEISVDTSELLNIPQETEIRDQVVDTQELVQSEFEVQNAIIETQSRQKESFESSAIIQNAVKIIDGNSSEGILEDVSNLDDIKSAIVSKKEDIEDNIKETIENVVTDISVDPKDCQKQKVDLGDAVIEKGILTDAEEKVNKLTSAQQKSEDSNESETVFVAEDTEKVSNPFFDMSNEVVATSKDKEDSILQKVPEAAEPTVSANKNLVKETDNLLKKKEEIPMIEQKTIQKVSEDLDHELAVRDSKLKSQNNVKSKPEQKIVQKDLVSKSKDDADKKDGEIDKMLPSAPHTPRRKAVSNLTTTPRQTRKASTAGNVTQRIEPITKRVKKGSSVVTRKKK